MCRDKCVEFTLNGESIRVMVPSLVSSAKDCRKMLEKCARWWEQRHIELLQIFLLSHSCHYTQVTFARIITIPFLCTWILPFSFTQQDDQRKLLRHRNSIESYRIISNWILTCTLYALHTHKFFVTISNRQILCWSCNSISRKCQFR